MTTDQPRPMTATQLNTARYHGLTLTDLQILLVLGEDGPLEIDTLAERIGTDRAAAIRAVKKLIAKLLVRVAERMGDAVWLSLCELGRVRVHQITGVFPEPVPA